MSKTIPEKYRDLFQKKSLAHVATLMPDGSPHVTPVWVDYDGTYILVNSAAGRQKDRNMEKRPQVAVDIIDPDNPYRYLAVRGQVVEITEDGADAHIDRLAQRYLDTNVYPRRRRDETRRIYKIRPDHVISQG